jgi:hypothetical protein
MEIQLSIQKAGVSFLSAAISTAILIFLKWLDIFRKKCSKLAITVLIQNISVVLHAVLFYLNSVEGMKMHWIWIIFDGVGYILMCSLFMYLVINRYWIISPSAPMLQKFLYGLLILQTCILVSDVLVFFVSNWLELNWSIVNKVGIATKIVTYGCETIVDLLLLRSLNKIYAVSRILKAKGTLIKFRVSIVVILILNISILFYSHFVHFIVDVMSKCWIYAVKVYLVLDFFESARMEMISANVRSGYRCNESYNIYNQDSQKESIIESNQICHNFS